MARRSLWGTVVLAADSPIEAEFVWTMRNVGVDRVILGSDFPQMSLAQAVSVDAVLAREGYASYEKAKALAHGCGDDDLCLLKRQEARDGIGKRRARRSSVVRCGASYAVRRQPAKTVGPNKNRSLEGYGLW